MPLLSTAAGTLSASSCTNNIDICRRTGRMDNRTAVFYVNRMGGTRSPVRSALTIQLWQWCLERNLSLSAEYLPGADNCIASGRRGIQGNPVISGVATLSGSNPADNDNFWVMHSGSVCLLAQCSAKTFCKLKTRPKHNWNRWIKTPMGQVDSLCIPTILSNRKMPQDQAWCW